MKIKRNLLGQKEIDISIDEIKDLFEFQKKLNKWEASQEMKGMEASKWSIYLNVSNFINTIWNLI